MLRRRSKVLNVKDQIALIICSSRSDDSSAEPQSVSRTRARDFTAEQAVSNGARGHWWHFGAVPTTESWLFDWRYSALNGKHGYVTKRGMQRDPDNHLHIQIGGKPSP